jgi:hypothetical protein
MMKMQWEGSVQELFTEGSRGTNPHPRKLWGFEELQTFIWTTILNQPHNFYQTKKTLGVRPPRPPTRALPWTRWGP